MLRKRCVRQAMRPGGYFYYRDCSDTSGGRGGDCTARINTFDSSVLEFPKAASPPAAVDCSSNPVTPTFAFPLASPFARRNMFTANSTLSVLGNAFSLRYAADLMTMDGALWAGAIVAASGGIVDSASEYDVAAMFSFADANAAAEEQQGGGGNQLHLPKSLFVIISAVSFMENGD